MIPLILESASRDSAGLAAKSATVNLRTKILDFRGFDSSRILIVRGGILMSIGNFPESLSQAILVGRFLVGRLGVALSAPLSPPCRLNVPPGGAAG